MTDIVAFLNARLDEDEAAAKEAWGVEWDWRYVARPFGEHPSIAHTVHIARHDPARVLRDVEADRVLLALHDELWRLYRAFEEAGEPGPISLGRAQALSRVLRIRAARFSDHPDYRAEWKP